MLSLDMPPIIVLPRYPVTSSDGVFAAWIWTIPPLRSLRCLWVLGCCLMAGKILSKYECCLACSNCTFELRTVFLEVLVQEIPLGKCILTLFALETLGCFTDSIAIRSLRQYTWTLNITIPISLLFFIFESL